MADNIRVYIGSETKTEIARLVLQHSILRRTKACVTFTPMIGPEWEYSTSGLRFGTGFSLRRWMIPKHCRWKGRAIYLDADQIVLGDIKELWRTGNDLLDAVVPKATVIACTEQSNRHSPYPVAQTSVMVVDCARAKSCWLFDVPGVLEHLRAYPDKKTYTRIMQADHVLLSWPLPPAWNVMGDKVDKDTKLVHYTRVPSQPWYQPEAKLAHLWKVAFQQAVAAGIVTRPMVEAACATFGKDSRGEPTGLHPVYRKHAESAYP